jgi:methylmalonyl-CoA mutase C-terminal domain/subunit
LYNPAALTSPEQGTPPNLAATPNSYVRPGVLRETEDGMDKKIRILIAKPGLDGHDRGAKVIARALRDAGMEVIYTGLRQTPEMIAEAALQEDVDAVGLSILSGAHLTLLPRIIDQLRAKGLDDVLVFAGGIIPDEDVEPLKQAGVTAVFGPGTNTDHVIEFIRGQFQTA